MKKNIKLVSEKARRVRVSYIFIIGIFIILLGASLVSAVTISGDDSSLITIDEGIVCSADGNTWINTNTGLTTPTTGPFHDCYDDTLTHQTCCPRGQICNIVTEECELTEKDICADLVDQTECEDYLQVVADKSINDIKASNYCGTLTPSSTPNCVDVRECSCVWDTTNLVCNAVDKLDTYCDTTGGGGTTSLGTCTYTLLDTVDKCEEDGFIYYKWGGTTLDNHQDCTSNTGLRPVPCEGSVRLGFFNWFSFIAVMFILGIYYFMVVIRTPKTSY